MSLDAASMSNFSSNPDTKIPPFEDSVGRNHINETASSILDELIYEDPSLFNDIISSKDPYKIEVYMSTLNARLGVLNHLTQEELMIQTKYVSAVIEERSYKDPMLISAINSLSVGEMLVTAYCILEKIHDGISVRLNKGFRKSEDGTWKPEIFDPSIMFSQVTMPLRGKANNKNMENAGKKKPILPYILGAGAILLGWYYLQSNDVKPNVANPEVSNDNNPKNIEQVPADFVPPHVPSTEELEEIAKTAYPSVTPSSEVTVPPEKFSENEIQQMVKGVSEIPQLVARMEPDGVSGPESMHIKTFYVKDTEDSLMLQKLTGYWLKLWAMGKGDLINDIELPDYSLTTDWSKNTTPTALEIYGPIVWTKETISQFEQSGNQFYLTSTTSRKDIPLKKLFPDIESRTIMFKDGERTSYWTDILPWGYGITIGVDNFLEYSREMSKVYNEMSLDNQFGFVTMPLRFSGGTESFAIPTAEDGRIIFTDILVLGKGNKVVQLKEFFDGQPVMMENMINGQVIINSESFK